MGKEFEYQPYTSPIFTCLQRHVFLQYSQSTSESSQSGMGTFKSSKSSRTASTWHVMQNTVKFSLTQTPYNYRTYTNVATDKQDLDT